jgi:FxLD family lantipeptide
MATATDVVEDAFVLDVQVISNVPGGASAAIPCATDDGCATTCASSCSSNV